MMCVHDGDDKDNNDDDDGDASCMHVERTTTRKKQ